MTTPANAGLGINATVVRHIQSFSVIFTLKYSLLFEVFGTIVETGEGESKTPGAMFG